jgi:hypothetical protein
MVLLLDPRSPLLEAEAAALARHVRGGGRLWVTLEPGGSSLEGLLGELGARPSAGPVHTATGGDRPLVRASRGHPVTAAIDAPFALDGALAFERIRAPSMRAVAPLRVDEGWIDDGDGELGEGEAVEPRPVLVAVRAMARRSETSERPREGRAVLLGDASPLFRLDEGGPRALVRSTLEWLGDRPGARTPTIATGPEELERHHGRGDARPVYLAVAFAPPLLLFGVAWSRRRRP